MSNYSYTQGDNTPELDSLSESYYELVDFIKGLQEQIFSMGENPSLLAELESAKKEMNEVYNQIKNLSK
jgi:hypothetical protein